MPPDVQHALQVAPYAGRAGLAVPADVLVDLVGRHEGDHTRVLPSERLSAYCVPGAGSRLVITEAALIALPDDELAGDAATPAERASAAELVLGTA